MSETKTETKLTAEEVIDSLTGFDEIAIAKAWGAEWSDLAETKPSTFNRSLVFTLFRRAGKTDAEAKAAALELTLKEVTEAFADDEDEVMPEEPETESGKGDSGPTERPTT